MKLNQWDNIWLMSCSLGTATATVFAGAITGQLSMGYAGDVLGEDFSSPRKTSFI